MATKNYYFTGIAKWAKLKSVDEKYGKFQLPLYLDEPSWELFHESKLQLRPKKDADGEYVKFSCAPSSVLGNRTITFGPIETVKLVGQDELGNDLFEPVEQLVGNGSAVTAKVEVYDTRNGKGHRLRKVLVRNLVPYIPVKKEGSEREEAGDKF